MNTTCASLCATRSSHPHGDPLVDTKRAYVAAEQTEKVLEQSRQEMVTHAAFQRWWASPASPAHKLEAARLEAAAAAQAAEAEAEQREVAAADSSVGHGLAARTHYNVFELSWDAAQAELSRRGEVTEVERETGLQQQASESQAWEEFLETPHSSGGGSNRDLVASIHAALEELEGAMGGTEDAPCSHAAVVAARQRMTAAEQQLEALGECMLAPMKKIRKRLAAAGVALAAAEEVAARLRAQEELKERRQEAQLAAAELFEDGCVLNTDIVRLPACPLVEGRNLLVF